MKRHLVLLLLVLSLGAFAAATDTSHPAGDAFDRTIDKITAREAENVKTFEKYSPIVETYIQGFRKDKELGRVPVEDQYFLGRASFKSRLQDDPFIAQERPAATHQLPYSTRPERRQKSCFHHRPTDGKRCSTLTMRSR